MHRFLKKVKMPQKRFLQRKKDILSKKDKSHIGGIDKRIIGLCKKINKLDNYYTTSSCSGRIILIPDKDKKDRNLFLRRYHNLINFKQLKRDLEQIASNKKEMVKFKLDPCALHVACETLQDAKILLRKAQLAGWKKSGFVSSGRRFVLELNSTERLEFPIIYCGKIIVDNRFLKILVKRANEKLKNTWKKIKKLEIKIS